MLDWVMSVVGWEYLTPQGIRFGIASFLALSALAPGRPSWAAAPDGFRRFFKLANADMPAGPLMLETRGRTRSFSGDPGGDG